MGRVHRKKVLGRLVLAAAAGVLASAFMPLTAISVPAAGASTTADHDGDLVADIPDLDDDNDGLADDTECDGSAAGHGLLTTPPTTDWVSSYARPTSAWQCPTPA